MIKFGNSIYAFEGDSKICYRNIDLESDPTKILYSLPKKEIEKAEEIIFVSSNRKVFVIKSRFDHKCLIASKEKSEEVMSILDKLNQKEVDSCN